jgi:MraZ protein
MGNFLIGSYTARLDKSGRMKIPEKFRTSIEEQFGKDLFITSLTDEAIQIYPLSIWENLAGITQKGFLHLKPDVKMFLLRVNRKGTQYEIDDKGRVLINQSLREKAGLEKEVEVIGLNDHLEIWNKERLDEILEKRPLTDKEFDRIADLTTKGTSE